MGNERRVVREIYCYHHMGIDTKPSYLLFRKCTLSNTLQRTKRRNRRSARNRSYLYHPTRIYEIKRKQKLRVKP